MSTATPAVDPGVMEAARMLPARLGITPEQLLGKSAKPTEMPTLDDYVERVALAVSDGARRANASYWNRIRQVWGTRRLDEPTPLEIKQFAERCKAEVVLRSNSRGGRSAAEHAIAALRCIYRHAVADGLITEADNPAARVPKPRRLASTRRALNSHSSPRSSTWPHRPETTATWTAFCCASTSRPDAGAAARSPFADAILT